MSEISSLPPPDTAPESSLPLPKPRLPPTSLPIPSLSTLKSYLPLYSRKSDALLSHLTRILSTPSGIDTTLLTLCYTSLLVSSTLTSLSLHTLRLQFRRILSNALTLPPNATLIITTPKSRLLTLSTRLKAFSELISDFRIFVRLWGLLGIYTWGKRVFNTPPVDPLLRNIAYTQVASNVLFQYLENGAYLASKGVLGWSKEKQNKAWLWSSRFWMLHVGLDLVRLWREAKLRGDKGKSKDGSEGTEWVQKWRRDVLVNAAWAPLTLHWSLEQGLLGEFGIGVLGSVAGIAGFRELWRRTEV